MSDSQGKHLLMAASLSKSYNIGARSLEVLRGVSLEVMSGDFLAMRGASGAGKSTLLHLLGGLDQPTSGTVQFQGTLLSTLTDTQLARFRSQRIGLIFQAYHLLPEFDALENVCLAGQIGRRPVTQVREEAAALLQRVGLSHRMEHRPLELSGGEQQRVAIARALINHPTLVLADEPTGNLDSQTGEEIIRLLCELREERGMTLVIATHDAKVAAKAPRTVQLVDGRISAN